MLHHMMITLFLPYVFVLPYFFFSEMFERTCIFRSDGGVVPRPSSLDAGLSWTISVGLDSLKRGKRGPLLQSALDLHYGVVRVTL